MRFTLATNHFRSFFAILLFVTCLPYAFSQGAGYWHTAGNQILDSNNQAVRMA